MQRRVTILLFLVAVFTLLLTACGAGSQPSSITWRNVTLQMPADWYVFEEEETRLSISNADIGPDAIRGQDDLPDTDVVAMFLTYDPAVALPADWRRYADQQDAEVESDAQITLGDDVPATRLVFSYVTNDVPLREMVVVIPSRGIVVIAQPVPTLGQEDGPEIFLEHVDTFTEVLDTAEFGPPVLD